MTNRNVEYFAVMFETDPWLQLSMWVEESSFVVIQMLMSVLWITEAAVHTLTALTHLGATTVPVLEGISATDSTVQVKPNPRRI